MLASGCFSASATAPPVTHPHPPTALLTVRVRLDRCTPEMAGPCSPTIQRYRLRCGPAGGSMPDTAAACEALGDVVRARATGASMACMRALTFDPSTALLRGTVAGRPYRLRLISASSWCGRSRPIERDVWTLSTFPCTIRVLRTGSPSLSYAAWARRSGCGGSARTQ
jgi:hypothetical protein